MVDYPQVTRGLVRNMQAGLPIAQGGFGEVEPPLVTPLDNSGGGNLNGSANVANLLGHAGTGADRLSVPRQNIKAGSGNYCGII